MSSEAKTVTAQGFHKDFNIDTLLSDISRRESYYLCASCQVKTIPIKTVLQPCSYYLDFTSSVAVMLTGKGLRYDFETELFQG